jgi:hypothetical protein
MTILAEIEEQSPEARSVRIVSPYLFLAEYKNEDGEIVADEAQEFIQWLEDNPDAKLEIITNSVLTSDNFPGAVGDRYGNRAPPVSAARNEGAMAEPEGQG